MRVIGLCLLLALLVSCGQSSDAVRIGAILHLTGDQAEPAEAFLEGIELAVREINDNGGIAGEPVRLLVEDDNLDSRKAHTAAIKLVSVDDVDGVILASYTEAMATGAYLEEQSVPSIVLWDTAKEIENVGDYMFGIGIWTPSAGEEAAKYAREVLDLQTVSVVSVQNPWSLAVSDFFTSKFEEMGGTVTESHSVPPSDTNDFRSVIAEIIAENPDGVYSPITEGITVFYKQLAELGWERSVLTSDIIMENHVEILGDAAEGIYQTQAMSPSGTTIEHMEALYEMTYGQPLKQQLFVAWGYDAVYLFKEAMENSGSTDGEAVKDALYELEYDGASALIDFDSSGSSRTVERMHRIKDGTFILAEAAP